jgi:hypothetical protein
MRLPLGRSSRTPAIRADASSTPKNEEHRPFLQRAAPIRARAAARGGCRVPQPHVEGTTTHRTGGDLREGRAAVATVIVRPFRHRRADPAVTLRRRDPNPVDLQSSGTAARQRPDDGELHRADDPIVLVAHYSQVVRIVPVDGVVRILVPCDRLVAAADLTSCCSSSSTDTSSGTKSPDGSIRAGPMWPCRCWPSGGPRDRTVLRRRHRRRAVGSADLDVPRKIHRPGRHYPRQTQVRTGQRGAAVRKCS